MITVTDDMVAEALDAKASMSQLHHYMYSTEKCRCGEEWSDSHWMRFILERAMSRADVEAEEPEWEYGIHCEISGQVNSVGAPWMDRKFAEKVTANDSGNYGVCRRKAGPWLPVKP